MKVILIFGPTGVSKSDVSIELAMNIGEIISADSMQVYRDMNIGTAKLSVKKRSTLPHHLIDLINPDQDFSASDFFELANNLIGEIIDRGKIPFIVGGTGLYFKVLLDGLFNGPQRNDEIRSNLETIWQNKGKDFLYSQLKLVDPVVTQKIHVNDKKRVIRALEVFKITGKPLSEHWKEQQTQPTIQFLKIGLTMDREKLYQRINKRCDDMLMSGLVDEVRQLKEAGYESTLQSMKAIGYRHVYQHLTGEFDYAEMVRLFKRDTRRFAKRQWTLFLQMNNVHWFSPNDVSHIKKLISQFSSL